MSDVDYQFGHKWERGDLSSDSVEDGPIRVYYYRYFETFFEDFATVEDATHFVSILEEWDYDADGHLSHSLGALHAVTLDGEIISIEQV